MIVLVTGARPNFIKVKPLIDRCKEMGVDYRVYNSNQHEKSMQVFEMGEREDHTISHNREGRFAWIMSDFSRFLNGKPVDTVLVVGDTDTSFACALTADMRGIPVAHVEAGMRSHYKMPEETNRVAIDHLSTYLFAPTQEAVDTLERERLNGILVGNIMIESLKRYWEPKQSDDEDYILMEIHRPENDTNMKELMEFASRTSLPVRWVQHPRHRNNYVEHPNIKYLPPQPYEDMLNLVLNSQLVITDSGGLQVDSTYMKVPCITVRKNTEWTITVRKGCNYLVGNVKELRDSYNSLINSHNGDYDFSDQLWDDKVSERILNHIIKGVTG